MAQKTTLTVMGIPGRAPAVFEANIGAAPIRELSAGVGGAEIAGLVQAAIGGAVLIAPAVASPAGGGVEVE